MRSSDSDAPASNPFRRDGDDVLLAVRLTPRGGRDAVDGVERLADGMPVLKARVRAIPEDGKANAALLALVAKSLGVPRKAVSLASGATSRIKHLRIAACAPATMARLELLCSP